MFSIAKQKNLYHWFQNKSISAQKLNKYLQNFPETDRNIGELPFDWIKSFPKNERAKITRLVQDTFVSFSKETAGIRSAKGENPRFVNPERFETAQKRLVSVLKNILKRDDIAVSYNGSGALKNCHRLDVGNYSYALCSFRDKTAAKKGFEDYFVRAHGRGNEPQNAITAYKRGSHGRFVKAFSVRVSDCNDEGGFILSKFVDKQTKAPIGKLQESRGKFINLDQSSDTINNINTDIGGCLPNPRYIANKTAKHKLLYFAKLLDIQIARLSSHKAVGVQKYLLQQKQNCIDIFAPDFVNHMKLSPEEKKIAVKMLRGLKKIRAQKEKLVNSGEFEKIKKFLEDDISFVFSDKKKSNEFLQDVITKFETYPQLYARELGIAPETVLKNWASLYREYGTKADMNIKNFFSREEVIDFLEKNYQNIRLNDSLVIKLKSDFKLSKEISALEKSYKQSDIGKAETGWESFYAFMKR